VRRTLGSGFESVLKLVVSLPCTAGYVCVCGPVDKRMLCDAVYAFYIFRRNEFNVTAAANGERRTEDEGTAAHCEISNFRFLQSWQHVCLAVQLPGSPAVRHHMRLAHMSALCVLKVGLQSWPISALLNLPYVLWADLCWARCASNCKGIQLTFQQIETGQRLHLISGNFYWIIEEIRTKSHSYFYKMLKKCGRYTGFSVRIVCGRREGVAPCWNKLALRRKPKKLHAKSKHFSKVSVLSSFFNCYQKLQVNIFCSSIERRMFQLGLASPPCVWIRQPQPHKTGGWHLAVNVVARFPLIFPAVTARPSPYLKVTLRTREALVRVLITIMIMNLTKG